MSWLFSGSALFSLCSACLASPPNSVQCQPIYHPSCLAATQSSFPVHLIFPFSPIRLSLFLYTPSAQFAAVCDPTVEQPIKPTLPFSLPQWPNFVHTNISCSFVTIPLFQDQPFKLHTLQTDIQDIYTTRVAPKSVWLPLAALSSSAAKTFTHRYDLKS